MKRAELFFQKELRRNYPWKQSAKLTKQTPRERQTAGILHKPALLCTRAVASQHPTVCPLVRNLERARCVGSLHQACLRILLNF